MTRTPTFFFLIFYIYTLTKLNSNISHYSHIFQFYRLNLSCPSQLSPIFNVAAVAPLQCYRHQCFSLSPLHAAPLSSHWIYSLLRFWASIIASHFHFQPLQPPSCHATAGATTTGLRRSTPPWLARSMPLWFTAIDLLDKTTPPSSSHFFCLFCLFPLLVLLLLIIWNHCVF